MVIYAKKELSQKLQAKGLKPISEDVSYDTYSFDKQLPSCFSNVDKKDYMIANGISFVKGMKDVL